MTAEASRAEQQSWTAKETLASAWVRHLRTAKETWTSFIGPLNATPTVFDAPDMAGDALRAISETTRGEVRRGGT